MLQQSPTIRSFFIRTSKFCLRLAVLDFFFIFEAEMFLICSYFSDWTLQCHKEECQTEYNKNTLFHFFHSFSFKQRTKAATGRCSTKNRFCNCAKINQKIPAKEFNLSLKLHTSSLQLYYKWTLSQVFFYRFWTQMRLYTL